MSKWNYKSVIDFKNDFENIDKNDFETFKIINRKIRV